MADEATKELWRTEWRSYRTYAEELFKGHVAKANELVRQLALAGIAVVWIFRETVSPTQFVLAPELRWAAILFLSSVALDFGYYLIGFFSADSRLDRIIAEEQAALQAGKAWPIDPSGPPPAMPQGAMKFFFFGKVFVLIAGAVLLLYSLAFRL